MGALDRLVIGCIFIVSSVVAYFGHTELELVLSPYVVVFLAALGVFYFLSGIWFARKLVKRPRAGLPRHSQVNPFRSTRK